MRLSGKITTVATLAILFVPGFNVFASEAPNPSANAAQNNSSTDSSVAVVADPLAPLPIESIPESSLAAASPYLGASDGYYPKVELFLGYSYLLAVPKDANGNRLVWLNGGSTSLAFNLNRYLGIVGDFGGFNDSRLELAGAGVPSAVVDSDGTVFTYLIGPRFSYRKYDRITPFAQVLLGGIHASDVTLESGCAGTACTVLPSENSFALTAGGGFDFRLRRHLAFRLIQAEYLLTRLNDLGTGSTGTQSDVRLSTGLVFRFGGGARTPEREPITYSCSVNPTSVFAGEPIAVSGAALNLNPSRNDVYTWSVDSGTVTGSTSTASIDTSNVAPGTYTLKGHISEGDKPRANASCTAPYQVKAPELPTVSCSGSPSTVNSGDASIITAIGVSPQSRPLSYTYSSTSGTVSGNGPTATLSTGGVSAGPITVTCNVADDKGQTASGTTSVTVEVPAPVKPAVSQMCSISFERDARRKVRVDNEGKACLDQVALNLQSNSDEKLALVGNASSREQGGTKLATERAVNTKAYLVGEKGIDPTRITVYTGSQDGKIVSTTIIPTGATFDTTGDTPVE
jgi:opacity protein-like surface antigen